MKVTDDQKKKIKVQLVAQELRMFDLAQKLRMPTSSFSARVNGQLEAPEDFISRIEKVLHIPAGTIGGAV
jgi:hypothetical protein